MKLYLSGHEDRYAIEQLLLCLFPLEKIDAETADPAALRRLRRAAAARAASSEAFSPLQAGRRGTASAVDEGPGETAPDRPAPDASADYVVSTLSRGERYLTASAVICRGGVRTRAVQRLALANETYALRRRILQRSCYLAAMPHLPAPPPWGAMSGVRPTKITTRHLLSGGTPASADRLLRDVFFVSPERRKLCVRASEFTVRAASLLEPTDLSVYVGIPFCPTRCAYCSFVSQTIGSAGALLGPYLDCLLREIETVGAALRQTGRRVRTLYIGGGTPTTLSAEQLKILMEAIARHFDLDRLIEYTVEAGRPDTVTPEKLRVIRSLGANRVSINPQTMNDDVLRAARRPHTAADVERAYAQAVDAGFTHINMDLIAGLAGDDPASFEASLRRVLALDPSNVTVHTLTLKKGADLFSDRAGLPAQADVEQMVRFADEILAARGYEPYYLYKQKYMAGSLENVGWCRDKDACLYNIYMMEELHSILALGGGAVSKRNLSASKLVRQCNPKFPKEYVERISDVLSAKRELIAALQDDGMRQSLPD